MSQFDPPPLFGLPTFIVSGAAHLFVHTYTVNNFSWLKKFALSQQRKRAAMQQESLLSLVSLSPGCLPTLYIKNTHNETFVTTEKIFVYQLIKNL